MEQTDDLIQQLMSVIERNCELLGMKPPLEYGTYGNMWSVMVQKLSIDTLAELDIKMGENYKIDDSLGYMHRKVRERLNFIH